MTYNNIQRVSTFSVEKTEKYKDTERKPDTDSHYDPAQPKKCKEEKLIFDQKGSAHPNQVGLQVEVLERSLHSRAQQEKIDNHLRNTDAEIEQIRPDKKRAHKPQKPTDAIPEGLLKDILEDPKPEGTHALTWARFRLTCVLLAFGGFRANEVASISIYCLNRDGNPRPS